MSKVSIRNIHRGVTAHHTNFVYAALFDANGLLLLGTLDHLVEICRDRGLVIDNGQEVLEWLLGDGQLTRREGVRR